MRSLDSPAPARVGRLERRRVVGAGRARAARRPRRRSSRRVEAERAVSPSPRRPVGSVTRAMALLDALAESDSGLGVNELARRIGVNASTASRLLATLEERGPGRARPAGGPYRLGLRLVALADRVLGQLDVRQRARPLLERLVERDRRDGHAVGPERRRGGHRGLRPVAVERGQHGAARAPERPARDRGGQDRAGLRGAGRRAARGRATARPATPSARSPTRPRCAAELAAVRERGYAEAIGEREPDLGAVAAPVFGRGGELAAILGLQGPVARLPAGHAARDARAAAAAAAELGRLLGA